MSRLDKWKKEWRIPLAIIGDDDELVPLARQRWRRRDESEKEKEPGTPTLSQIIEAAKELIFDIDNSEPVFHVIMLALDPGTFELVAAHIFDIVELGTKDQIKGILATAMALDVPVYPNTDDIAPMLVSYHKDLLIHGFKSEDRSGEEVRLVPTKFRDIDIESLQFVEAIKSEKCFCPLSS